MYIEKKQKTINKLTTISQKILVRQREFETCILSVLKNFL